MQLEGSTPTCDPISQDGINYRDCVPIHKRNSFTPLSEKIGLNYYKCVRGFRYGQSPNEMDANYFVRKPDNYVLYTLEGESTEA